MTSDRLRVSMKTFSAMPVMPGIERHLLAAGHDVGASGVLGVQALEAAVVHRDTRRT